jgi:hypothetical protein
MMYTINVQKYKGVRIEILHFVVYIIVYLYNFLRFF